MTGSQLTASDHLRRVFNRRYAIVIALLAAAACASFALSYKMSLSDTNRAKAFNLVHTQRTDSQRIAFLITSLETTRDVNLTEGMQDELQMVIARMRRTHEILIGRHPEAKSIHRFIEPLQAIYSSGEEAFDERVLTFLEHASVIAATKPGTEAWEEARKAREELVTAATDTILQTHGLMSLILEAQAARSNEVDKALNVATWLCTLALLAFITLVIFRPMIGYVLRSVQDMVEARESAQRAEKAATVANEAKGHFFQAASHELRTPLNAILGMTDALKDKADPDIENELTQVIAASEQLLTLLNNILDTHRLSDGRLDLEAREFVLRDVLERPLTRIAALAETKGLTFSSNIDIETNLAVLGDAPRLEQIVYNIVDNAVKFTPEGEITVDAKVLAAAAGLNFALVVKDTGIGMTAEEIDNLFDLAGPEGSRLSRNGGLGVGLVIVRAIVSSMGGTLDVSSSKGKGTTITVSIPLEEADIEPAQLDRTEDITAEASIDVLPDAAVEPVSVKEDVDTGNDVSPPQEDKIRVLIVDDNMANRMVAEALVKPLGAQTFMAADGRQAVDRALEDHFDLILMDISMPVMDGVKATKLIRESDGPNRETPVIALTAHVGPGEWSGLGEVGFNDILNKPVRKDMIQKSVEKWVRRPVFTAEKAA